MLADKLTDAQIEHARGMWAAGCSLGLIAKALDCSIYALSPWLYMEGLTRTTSRKQAGA